MSTIKRVRARIYLETDTGTVIDSMFDTDLGNTIPEVLTGTLTTMAEITALSNFGSLIQASIDQGIENAMQRLERPGTVNPKAVSQEQEHEHA